MRAASVLKKGWGSLSSSGGKVVAGGFFAVDTMANMSGGDDLGTAAIKSAGVSVLAASNPVLFTGLTLAPLAVEGSIGFQKFMREKENYWSSQFAYSNTVGGNYMDTQRAQTMRQAAVQAIQGSKLNARSALGGEAKIMNPYAARSY